MSQRGTGTWSRRSRVEGKPKRERARPQLFFVLECDRPLAGSARHSLADCDEVIIERGKARGQIRVSEAGRRRLQVRVPDQRMSSPHVKLARRGARWSLADTESKNGTFINGAPYRQAQLADGDIIELGHSFFLYRE